MEWHIAFHLMTAVRQRPVLKLAFQKSKERVISWIYKTLLFTSVQEKALAMTLVLKGDCRTTRSQEEELRDGTCNGSRPFKLVWQASLSLSRPRGSFWWHLFHEDNGEGEA
jgi:hypothetical protein